MQAPVQAPMQAQAMDASLWADLLALLESADAPDGSFAAEDARSMALGDAMDVKMEHWSGDAERLTVEDYAGGKGRAGGSLDVGHSKSVARSVTPGAVPIREESPTSNAAELRRKRNREFMRGARLRHREELRRMKATVEILEKKYAELCLVSAWDSSQPRAVPSSPASPSSALSAPRRDTKPQYAVQLLYARALEMVRQLGAENLLLRGAVRDKAAWKLQLQNILESLPGTMGSVPINTPLGSPQSTHAGIGYLPLDTLDPDAAHSIFGFTPLTEEGVTALILDNSHQMNSVRTQLEALQRVGDSQLLSRQVFGWDVVQRVTQGSIMEFMFTKRFSGLSVREIMHGTWANDMNLEKYRKVKCDVKRLEVLQVANANAYILGRDVRAPDNSTVFRSVYLRYLIETTQSLPNPRSRQRVADGSGSESEDTEIPPLKASGFILGTHSANRDWSQSGHASSNIPKLPDCDLLGLDDHEKLVWADLALSIEFLDVEDPVTGETYQRARWMGRTDYKSGTDALRNTADMLSGCLRWELLMISPALNLISLDLS